MNKIYSDCKSLEVTIPSPSMVYKVMSLSTGLILPLLLIPVVSLVAYSEIVEEVVKGLVVVFIILKILPTSSRFFWAVVFGFCFGFSESVLYLPTLCMNGGCIIFAHRLISSVPMHILTVLVMTAFGMFGKKYLIAGLFFAAVIHLLFNNFVSYIFL